MWAGGGMGLLPDTQNCGLRMRRECRERFPPTDYEQFPYSLPSNLPSNMINTNSPFGILSLNTESLSAKFSDLQILLEALSSQNIHFPLICIQESWISDETMLQLLHLHVDGYNTFHVNATSSKHGGVVTHVDNSYDVTIKAQVNNSDIWDGLFIEIKHENIKTA